MLPQNTQLVLSAVPLMEQLLELILLAEYMRQLLLIKETGHAMTWMNTIIQLKQMKGGDGR